MEMPEANDAELTRLFTASVSRAPAVEDDEPNTGGPGNSAATEFYLFVEGVAGNVRGNDLSNYRLYLDAFADTPGAPALASFALDQEFKDPPWTPGGQAGNYVTQQVFTIPVPAGGVARGHVYHYEGRLVGINDNVVSFKQSNRFILV
jgi:hypothetical protein